MRVSEGSTMVIRQLIIGSDQAQRCLRRKISLPVGTLRSPTFNTASNLPATELSRVPILKVVPVNGAMEFEEPYLRARILKLMRVEP
jgi:hypothetical protein